MKCAPSHNQTALPARLAALILCALFALLSACSPAPVQTAVPAPETPSPEPGPAPTDVNGQAIPDDVPAAGSSQWIAVDAYNLYSEWNENPVRGKLYYHGQWVRVCYPKVSDLTESAIWVDELSSYGCSVTGHIDDVLEATKTNIGAYPVLSGYFVVEEGTKNFHLYHAQVLESLDYDSWNVKRWPDGAFGALADVTEGWGVRLGELPAAAVSTAEPTQPADDGLPAEEPSGYLLPTNTQYITEEDLHGLSQEEVKLARNEIYARYGYDFRSEELRSYFASQSWYVASPGVNSTTFSNDQLNEFEAANLNTIIAYEKSMGWR